MLNPLRFFELFVLSPLRKLLTYMNNYMLGVFTSMYNVMFYWGGCSFFDRLMHILSHIFSYYS